MSTILNALKRLEDQRRAGDAQQVPVSMAGRGAVSGDKSRLRLVFILLGLIIIVGAPVFWAYRHWSADGVRALDAAPPKPQTQAAPPAASRKAPAAGPRTGDRPVKAARTVQENSDRRPLKTAAGATTNIKTVLNAPDYRPPDPEGPNTPVRSPQDLPAGRTNDPSRPRPAAPRPADPDPFALTEVLPKDALQLQAISWSEMPSERITIVTGRILREGQSIDGYTVVVIRSEDVIVEKEGKRWRLVYGSQ